MKRLVRLLAVLTFFTVSANLHSFGSSVLCQSMPAAVTVGQSFEILLECYVPASWGSVKRGGQREPHCE